jgi:hypothetical protein
VLYLLHGTIIACILVARLRNPALFNFLKEPK